MIRSFVSILTGAAAAVLLGMGAQAQVMKNHDSNAPVNFNADRIEVQDRADRVVVSGNVEVTQAGLKLNAARMTVAYRNTPNARPSPTNAAPDGMGSNVAIDRIDASGNVAIYDLNKRLITMLGNVELNQGTNRLTGGRLVIDLVSGRSTVDGHSTAGGVSTGAGGRVSGTFTVPQRTQQPQ
jgi:lipopolysaccharide export system protein LptA